MIEPGSWTAHDDLAELADTTPNEVADFLASGKSSYPRPTGSCTPTAAFGRGMLNASYRGTDLRRRLAAEGIEFDASGRASLDST